MAAVLGGPEVGLAKWNRTIGPPNLRVDADVTVSFGRHVSVLAAGTQGRAFAVMTCFLVRNAMSARIPEFPTNNRGIISRCRNGPIKDRKAKAASTLQKSEALSTERAVGVLYRTKGFLGEGIGQRVETRRSSRGRG